MTESIVHDLFICHPWYRHSEYKCVVELLRNARSFRWRRYSVPCHDPAIDPKTESGLRELTRELSRQIGLSSCVLVPSGIYEAHPDWIRLQMDLAEEADKPMIAVDLWGMEQLPGDVGERVEEVVDCDADSIVSAVEKVTLKRP